MNRIFTIIALFVVSLSLAQQPYYDDVNLELTGTALYDELQDKISNASSTFDYADARTALLTTDSNPSDGSEVLLVYGYNDTDGSCTTDRTRDKGSFGGLPCEYNREHVFARSNSVPSMGDVSNSTTGIGADPHNLRASDQQMNGNKGNRKFASGSGNAGPVGSNWFPGTEWRGDVARMMMYMYTRYGNRCLPTHNGSGALQSGTQMLQIYLQWNAEDPPTPYEDQRNEYLESVYGNRNPFIDNPVLATIIWGGPMAEDRWGLLDVASFEASQVLVYPNPSFDHSVTISTTAPVDSVIVYSLDGKEIRVQSTQNGGTIQLVNIPSGFYFVQLQQDNLTLTKKVIIR
ncbi:MAG: endonuclease [Gilvibacter sp.]